MGSTAYFDRVVDLGVSFGAVVFIGLLSLCLLGIVSTLYIKNTLLRVIYGLIFFVSSVVLLAYENITADFLTYNAFISLLNARGFAGEAFEQFHSQIVVSLLISLFLLVAIVLKPKYKPALSNKLFLFFPLSVAFLLTIMLFLRGGDGGKGLQSPFIPIAYASLAVYEVSNSIVGDREDVQIDSKDKKIDHDIIFIIDESISPGYLDINSEYGVLTNLKKKKQGVNIFNYGYAASITNCSYETNLSLRYGGTRDKYLTIISTMPSIWQYAKKVNMRTVYIDTQRTGMKLQNGMTDEELEYVDEFIQFDDTPVVSRDLAAASKIIELINNDKSEFVIINKIGGHFPVHDKFPDEYAVYKPSLPRGAYKNIADTGSREGFAGSMNDWFLYRNSYRNTLLWGVGHFFDEILTKSNLDNAVILYTSDHGQDLHETEKKGTDTHCSSTPRMDEGMVPLLIVQGEKRVTLNWKKHIDDNKNKSSHYNIFPTLLSLMSYDALEVRKIYGNSLDILTNDDLTFNTLFYARLGKKAEWKKIEPDNISMPPEYRHAVESGFKKDDIKKEGHF